MGKSGIQDQYGDDGISDVEGGLVMLLDDCTSCIDACLRVKPADRLRYFRWDLDDYSIQHALPQQDILEQGGCRERDCYRTPVADGHNFKLRDRKI